MNTLNRTFHTLALALAIAMTVVAAPAKAAAPATDHASPVSLTQPGNTLSIPKTADKDDAADEADDSMNTMPGVPKALVLTLGDEMNGDMVGVYMVAHVLERAIPTLEKELGTDKTGVLVLRVHSGGGYGSEVQKIVDLIQNEFKPRWRTVGWIDTAISAAAMSSHILEEIYFTSRGNYGACTGFYGSLDRPVQGRELQEALVQMERISAKAGWDPLIMRAMQIQQPVSATIDDVGNVKFIADLSGDIIVNRPREILTFNCRSAMKIKFSRGTADTLDELTKLMGYKELNWVGKKVEGSPWPISKSEKIQMDFRKQVHEDERLTQHYFRTLNMQIQAAEAAPKEQRGAFVGRAKQTLGKLRNMLRNNPNFAISVFNRPRDEAEQYLKDIEKQLNDLLK